MDDHCHIFKIFIYDLIQTFTLQWIFCCFMVFCHMWFNFSCASAKRSFKDNFLQFFFVFWGIFNSNKVCAALALNQIQIKLDVLIIWIYVAIPVCFKCPRNLLSFSLVFEIIVAEVFNATLLLICLANIKNALPYLKHFYNIYQFWPILINLRIYLHHKYFVVVVQLIQLTTYGALNAELSYKLAILYHIYNYIASQKYRPICR